MKSGCEIYTEITKDLLNGIAVGDLVQVNDWKQPLTVKAVSEHYFVMARQEFGKWTYSVCEKKPWGGIMHNEMCGGMFHVGPDSWIFGCGEWLDFNHRGEYDFSNSKAAEAYLRTFELPDGDENKSELSQRSAVPIHTVSIKRRRT